MGGWPSCLLVELLVKGTICILAFYYRKYTLSGQIIMCSEIIIIWLLRVYIYTYIPSEIVDIVYIFSNEKALK